MKVTLIWPNLGHIENGEPENDKAFVVGGLMEPLSLAVLSGLTPSDVEVVMYDDRIDEIPYDEPTDLVAITVEIYSAKRAYEIAGEFRNRSVPVVLGGIHATLLPEEASLYCDSIVSGDAEYVWTEIIEDVRNKQLKPFYQSAPGCPKSGLLPRKDIYNGKKYLPISLLQFGRGCHHACSFCSISSYFNKQHFSREPKEIAREIEELDKKKVLFFVDDNITANPEAAKKLFKELIPLKVRWVGQANIEMTKDAELMKLMEKSGCLGHVIGFESITQQGLKILNKGSNLSGFDKYTTSLKILKDHGLQCWASFTLGHDEDTLDTLYDTLDFCNKHKFCFAAFNIIMPYPKTQFYDTLEKENRLLYDGKWWLHPNYKFNRAAFVPKKIDPDDLTEYCFQMKKEWNNYSSMFGRLMKIALDYKIMKRLSYLGWYTFLFRIETFKKQGLRLGMHKNTLKV